MKTSIIIPVYNEEKTVNALISRVMSLKLDKEVIVVDDGSTDSSFEIINKLKGIKIARHTENLGKGAAVRTGLESVTGDIVIVQDADLELDPEQIPSIIAPIQNSTHEVVYGSRNLNGNSDKNRMFFFWFGGKLISWIANILYSTKLSDEACGYKAFRTELIKGLTIENNRFEWEPEITAKIAKKKIVIVEVPVKSISRSKEEGKKVKASDGFKAIWTLLKYRFK